MAAVARSPWRCAWMDVPSRARQERVPIPPFFGERCPMYRVHPIGSFLASWRRARKPAAVQRAVSKAVDNTLEQLESRRLYAVTASAAGGVLTILGDDNPNAIVVSRD